MIEAASSGTLWAGRLLLLGLLCVAAYTDHHERRIPNYVSVLLLISGLLWHLSAVPGNGAFDAISPGGLGLTASATGAFSAFGLFFVLYYFNVLGAGDVKLMTALGAWVGWQGLLQLTLMVKVSGGVLALCRLSDANRRIRLASNMRLIAIQWIAGGSAPMQFFDPKTQSADHLPYGCAILAGALMYAFARYLQWWSWL